MEVSASAEQKKRKKGPGRFPLKTQDKYHLARQCDWKSAPYPAAKNLPNALSVLAVTKRGNLLHAPDIYMEKIAIGPRLPKNLIDLDYGIEKNIKLLSEAKNTKPEKLSACVLKRPRHNSIIKSLNSMGVKINFITDGDVSVSYTHLTLPTKA